MKKYMYIATEDYDMVAVITASGAHILTDDKDEKAFSMVRDAKDVKAEAEKLLEEVRYYGDPEEWANRITVDELGSMLGECEIIADLEDEATIYQVCCWYGEDGEDDKSFDTAEEATARAFKLAAEAEYNPRRPFKCTVEEMAWGEFGWGATECYYDVVYAMPKEIEIKTENGYHKAEVVTVLPQAGKDDDYGTCTTVKMVPCRFEDSFSVNQRFYECHRASYEDWEDVYYLIREDYMGGERDV